MTTGNDNSVREMVGDEELIKYYYLNLTPEEVVNKLQNIKLTLCPKCTEVPFNAQVKGYAGATDEEGSVWVVKEVKSCASLTHKLEELVFILDFMMQTLAAPTIFTTIGNRCYRASKVVLNSVQISSYNYLENPFKKIIAKDLINRWLTFDEDRNPNNYMVIHNSKNEPLVVVIDYDKADLESIEMKITGNEEKFGWFRLEKTRFLTLLKPENFERLSIEDFDERLTLMMAIDQERLRAICKTMFRSVLGDPDKKADEIVANIIKRREYINTYFRKWFKEKDTSIDEKINDDYGLFGKSFMKIYKNKT